MKNAVDKAAGNSGPKSSGPASTDPAKLAAGTAAPIFDNDATPETSQERIQEVLTRSFEWGRSGSNTTGYRKMHDASSGLLPGFGSIAWKASQSQCVAALTERGAAVANTAKPQPGVEVINLQGGNFAGQNVAAWQLYFFNDQLFEARVEFVFPKGNVLREYRKMLRGLVTKYGAWSGEQDLRFLYLDLDMDYASKKRNASDDEEKHWLFLMRLDAQYAQALAGQSAQPMSRWMFDHDDSLTFWIPARSKMMLQYRNAALEDEAAKNLKKASSPEKDL